MQFDGKSKLDVHQLGKELAMFYSYLYFEEVYKGFETENIFNELIEDGWFPFIQLIGGDYENILAAYHDKFNFQNKIKGVVDKYDKQAIEGMSSKWWSNPIFSSKRKILQAGLDAYCQADESGYINSIKNIYTEIEGILQETFSPNEKKKIGDLCESLGTSCPEGSLYFSSYFKRYLLEFLYKNFDLENNEVDLSRHTVGHGIAKVEEYNKIRALQGLLILDQIFYYINKQ